MPVKKKTKPTTKPTTAPSKSSEVIGVLERAWEAVRKHHPEIPQVAIITGSGRRGRSDFRGYYQANQWTDADSKDGQLPEVFIAGEYLTDDAARIMTTVVHEAVHALAKVRDISESNRGYHNKKFAALAEEMGLTPPEKPDLKYGFSDCSMPAETEARYKRSIAAIDALNLKRVPLKDRTPTKSRNNAKMVCGCEDEDGKPLFPVRASIKVMETGSVHCNLCGQDYEEAE